MIRLMRYVKSKAGTLQQLQPTATSQLIRVHHENVNISNMDLWNISSKTFSISTSPNRCDIVNVNPTDVPRFRY